MTDDEITPHETLDAERRRANRAEREADTQKRRADRLRQAMLDMGVQAGILDMIEQTGARINIVPVED